MLSLIILIHEGGHFLMAKCFGVYCHEFSLGMGPVLYSKKKGETTFSLRAVPIGGYVMMAGDNDPGMEQEAEWLKNVKPEQYLDAKPVWQQIIIMGAGVFMNFVLAFFLIMGFALSSASVYEYPAVVESVMENGAGAAAGLEAGDTIIRLESEKAGILTPESQQDIYIWMEENKNSPVELTVLRDGEEVSFQLTPLYDEQSGRYLIGYQSAVVERPLGFLEGIRYGFQLTGNMLAALGEGFVQLFSGQHLDELSGPVGIYQVTQQSVQLGWSSYLLLIALISLNIGIFNLLPIPALDGGRIVMAAYEGLSRRKISLKLQQRIITISFVLLLSIMVFATWNDIMRLFS